jgi:3-isopropylmalate dehydratase
MLTSIHRTASRKNFTSVASFIDEPDSRAQCVALEDNVKEFGLTYFGMKDRRQGKLKHSYTLSLIV